MVVNYRGLDDNLIIYYLYYINLSIKYLAEMSLIWKTLQNSFGDYFWLFFMPDKPMCGSSVLPHQLSPRRAVMNETGVVFCQFEINGTTITL